MNNPRDSVSTRPQDLEEDAILTKEELMRVLGIDPMQPVPQASANESREDIRQAQRLASQR